MSDWRFGKHPPRAMQTFGVSGLLSKQSKVFYCSLFTPRHLGRVSDLIAARLEAECLDEISLRALLMFSAFEVFRAFHPEKATGGGHPPLDEPLIVECGVDEDKIAIGVSFVAAEERFPELEGLQERIAQRAPAGVFESLLCEIHSHADRTVVRVQPESRRVEVIALLGAPNKMDEAERESRVGIELIVIQGVTTAQAPAVEAYIELGDLDYTELLKDSGPGFNAVGPASGEVLVHGCKELEEAFTVRAEKLLEDMTGRKVRGGVTRLDDDRVLVSGAHVNERDETVFKVGGGRSGRKGAKSRSEGKLLRGRASGPDESIEFDETQALEPNEEIDGFEDEEDEDAIGAIQSVLKKVRSAWPFRFGKGNSDEDEDEDEDGDDESEVEDSDGDEELPESSRGSMGEVSSAEMMEASDELNSQIDTGMDRTIKKVIQEGNEIKGELTSPRARRWMEGMMSELVAEKARLHEAAKKLNTTMRQTEFEFRNKEQVLREELRRRDDQLKQKNNALTRAKEQITQATMSAERAKSHKSSSGEDAHHKQKLAMTQKLLIASKDENATLVDKIEELRAQLASAQLSGGKRHQVTDFTALQSKYERALRQTEELRKVNLQLTDKMSESKKDRGSMGGQEELKKRLESSQKMVANHQKESERLYQKIEDMQREQMRLQGELNRASNELKVAKVNKAKGAEGAKANGAGTAVAGGPGAPAAPSVPTPADGGALAPKGSRGKGNPPQAA